MSHNFLRDAKYIRNSTLCRYDTINGYTTHFDTNGDVDGWDIHHNIYMYGCWDGILFGSSYDHECYISRNNVFLSVDAEKYFFVDFMMYVERSDPNRTVPGLSKGKIMWMRTDDINWSDDRSTYFDIQGTDRWYYYRINMGPHRWWQGAINNLRFFPFIDGREEDKFFIKYIHISSDNEWMCTNTQCSYYQFYEHPCKGIGEKAYAKANISRKLYTTVSGVNSLFGINIDDYGIEYFELGDNKNISGKDIARLLGDQLSTLNVGGYAYVDVVYEDDNTIKISSGTNSSLSSVVIPYTKAAEELGFYEDESTPNYESKVGIPQASHFDYASTRLLQTFELNKLVDGNTSDTAYVHNPSQYSVEAGRRDFNEIGTSKLMSDVADDLGYYRFNGKGKTTLELSHRVDNNGRITHLWVYGVVHNNAKFKIMRPHNDGGFSVIYDIPIEPKDPGKLYTALPTVSRVDTNIIVNKGDVVAVYNVDIYVGITLTNLPDATFCQYDGDVSDRLSKSEVVSFGVGGLAVYARGDVRQSNTIIDIDLGNRLNVSEFKIIGNEDPSLFEFNIASCVDVSWDVDLFGESHNHSGYYLSNDYGWTDTHANIAYGIECLDDCIITADNGQVGDSYGSDNGLATYGKHAYFYVNGDAEWLYSYDCSSISEYCGNKYPTSTYNYEYDPIAFTLYFPNESDLVIHKSIIYFKEEDNFRNLALSYYKDPYFTFGNADDNRFVLIKPYNKVNLNGVWYNYGDNTDVDNYIFKNPMTDDLYNFDDQDKNATLISSSMVRWFILGHEFGPIKCKGFRIFTSKHKSTKITEIELYSYIKNNPSLTDNVLLYYSDFGKIWRTAGFKDLGDKTVYTYIGGTPRYFRLYFESQTEFSINELSIDVTEQVYVEDELVLLDSIKEHTISESKKIEVVNVYDESYDLTVDIPRDFNISKSILYWNRLNNDYSLTHPEYGPSALLYKGDDFIFTAYHGQCAVNCDCYGIRNLIDAKKSYICRNGYDWFEYKTLSSGISIDFCTDDYFNIAKYAYELDTVVSSQYWKCVFVGVDQINEIKDIIVFNNNDRQSIKAVYYSPRCDDSAQLNEIISDGIDLKGNFKFHDDFEDGDHSFWNISYDSSFTNITKEENGYLEMGTYTSSGYAGDVPGFRAVSGYFEETNSFEFKLEFSFTKRGQAYYNESRGYSGIHLYFYSNSNNIITIELHHPSLYYHELDSGFDVSIYINGAEITYSDVTLPDGLVRSGIINTLVFRKSVYSADLIVNDHQVSFRFLNDELREKFFFTPTDPINKIQVYCHAQAIEALRLHDLYFNEKAYIAPSTYEKLVNYIEDDFSGVDGSLPNIKLWTQNSDYRIYSNKLYIGKNCTNRNMFSTYDLVGDFSIQIYLDTSHLHFESWLTFAFGIYNSVDNWYAGRLHSSGNSYVGVRHNGSDWAYQPITNYSFKITLERVGSKLYVYFDDTLYTTGTLLVDYYKVWVLSTNPITKDDSYVTFDDFKMTSGTARSRLGGIGFKLSTSDPISKIYFNVSKNVPRLIDLYSSNTNANYTLVTSNDGCVISSIPQQFVVDLEQRHFLSIIRNYGDASNKLFISLNSQYVKFSNNDPTGLPNDSFNSTYEDCRLLKISLPNEYNDNYCLNKLGVYPSLTKAYCIGGGYNHTWDYLGTMLTYYGNSVNVALNADVSLTTVYFEESSPDKAVDGEYNKYSTYECWGYKEGTNPQLYMDFGKEVTINKIVLHGGYNPNVTDAVNKAYKLYLDNTVSGTNYVLVWEVSGLNSNETYTAYFDPTLARRARLDVTDFVGVLTYEELPDGTLNQIRVGYLREVELFTYDAAGEINSEDYPIVCINLRDKFNIVDHKLYTEHQGNSWDNDEQFFRYSDFVLDDPRKIEYVDTPSVVDEYYSNQSSDDMIGDWEFTFDESIYFSQGNHSITWQAYYPENVDEISITLLGESNITLYADNYGTGWVDQEAEFFIPESGYFSIVARQHIDNTYHWGARYPRIFRRFGLSKWVAVVRDTATDYAYDNDPNKKGKSYLSRVKLFGSDKYNLTEYYWWWNSINSDLYYDAFDTKYGTSSLVVDYTSASGIDVLRMFNGDTFGMDKNWNYLDSFSFWWYINDTSYLDSEFGYISIGSVKGSSGDFLYKWYLNNISLHNGWNKIVLPFYGCDEVYPYSENKWLDSSLDLYNTDREFSDLKISYRGKNDNLLMKLDTFNIKRNDFDLVCYKNKGLCLTNDDILVVPLSNVTLSKGTVEMWLRLGVDTIGRDIFGNIHSATIFTITNNNNDIISLRIKPAGWFELIVGNIRNQHLLNIENIPADYYVTIMKTIHVAVVWSNSGKDIDNADTLRLYINGKLLMSSKHTWEVKDTKFVYFKLGGGITQSEKIYDSKSGFIYEDLKVFNYCKEVFTDSSRDEFMHIPEKFVEISKDDVHFYGLGSDELPFVFEQVPPGEKVPIYIRVNKTNGLKPDKDTAQLIINWLTTV